MFGDIERGRLFAADLAAMKKADDGIPQTVAPIEEIQLYVRDAHGSRVNVSFAGARRAAMGATMARADLHISRSRDGELFITVARTARSACWCRIPVPRRGGRRTDAA